MKSESPARRHGARSLYARAAYAQAFPWPILDVPEWETFVLLRRIPASPWTDALGCYPLSVLHPQSDLAGGLQRLRAAGLVSVSLVPDPITSPRVEELSAAFPICRPFKTHYLIDRAAGPVRFSTTHRRWIRKALRVCQIAPISFRDSFGDWERLYRQIVQRHGITGMQDFSSAYFQRLAELPEVEAFCAQVEGVIVAMALWVRTPEVVYYHLGASDPRGYQSQAMYGIFARAYEHFAHARIIHLGGTAGVSPDEVNGLARFKQGFANREVEAYFCGACLDRERYQTLLRESPNGNFFPAYRTPS